MDLETISPTLEAGLAALRDAGLAGMSPDKAEDLADTILDDAWSESGLVGLTEKDLDKETLQWWGVDAPGALMASYQDGIREFEAQDSAPYRATILFEELPADATRADFIGALLSALPALSPAFAERTVDRVVRARTREVVGPYYSPHPTKLVVLEEDPAKDREYARHRRMALAMEAEARASRPKHDAIPSSGPELPELEPEPAAEASIEVETGPSSPEERRIALGMPSGLLRTVDYDPAALHTAPTWLVKGLFPDRGLGMLVGESQSGKSFLAAHATVCVARGVPFFGRKVKAGGVLYIAAEGGSSVLPRIKAADEAIGGHLPDNHITRKGTPPLARAPIKVMTETPNLSRDGDPAALARTIRAAARECEEEGYPLLFVLVDTYHAALCGGDEQSAADAGHALKPLREAVEELGLFVLIVHHPGKDIERGARGSSALRAAVDTEIEIRVPFFDGPKAKPAAVARRVTLTKQRDGAVGEEFHYRLNVVQLGRDEDGDPWTTCTVAPCEAPALDAEGKSNGRGDVRFRRALEAALAEHGGDRAPRPMVRGYFNNAGPADEKDDARRTAWNRALKKARDLGLIDTDSCDEWIWFSSPSSAGEP